MLQNDQHEIIAAGLAAGKTHEQAAKLAGVHRTTVTRLCGAPEFQALVATFRRQIVDRTLGLFIDSGAEAIEALREIVKDKNKKDSDRIKAAEKIIELHLKLKSDVDYEGRLQSLEDKFAAAEISPPNGGTGAKDSTGAEAGPAGAGPDDLDHSADQVGSDLPDASAGADA